MNIFGIPGIHPSLDLVQIIVAPPYKLDIRCDLT